MHRAIRLTRSDRGTIGREIARRRVTIEVETSLVFLNRESQSVGWLIDSCRDDWTSVRRECRRRAMGEAGGITVLLRSVDMRWNGR